jgi:hypothetical protein
MVASPPRSLGAIRRAAGVIEVTCVWTIALASTAIAAAPQTRVEPAPIAVAGILGGSAVVPLAQFEDGTWARTWPAPDDALELKIDTIDQLPRAWFPHMSLPRVWYVWAPGLRAVPVHVGNPNKVAAHCQSVWALGTDLPNTDHETTAFATDGRNGVEPFTEEVADDSLRHRLRADFDRSETAALGAKRMTAAQRSPSERDPVIRLWCADVAEEESLCAFAAARGRGAHGIIQSDESCEDQTIVQGWLLRSGGDVRVLSSASTLTDCDMKEFRSSVPALLIKANSRVFVVTREHGYEDESFIFYEWRDNTLKKVLEVPAGGC